jgi:mRNA interferase RelE/StbE
VNFAFRKSFARDLKKKAQGIKLRSRIQETIQEVNNAESLSEIRNLKKLKAEGDYYRIRLGDYRIGLKMEDGKVIFVRFLHRNEIYRYFP